MTDLKIGYRDRGGNRIATVWHDDGTVTVKTFGIDGSITTKTVTAEQFENAVVNHELRAIE